MTFFNKKEEVIDIELTQFGKAKLAKGLFKPTYYAFFDDDILYDSEYGGFAESQNDASQRIKDTVRPKTQHVFYGIETEYRAANRRIDKLVGEVPDEQVRALLLEPMQPIKDRYYSLSSPLGNAIVGEQKSPRWNINLLSSQISGNVTYDTITISKVPQIKIEPTWTSSIGYRTRSGDIDLQGDENIVLEGTNLSLGDKEAFMKINKEHIIIEVSEENAELLQRENFDIEIFKILADEETDSDGNINVPAVMEPLRFKERKKKSLVVNGILTDPSSDNTALEGSQLDELTRLMTIEPSPTDVEYYFNIYTDEDIDPEILCRELVRGGKRNDIFSDLQVDCPETVSNSIRPNIYRPEEYEDPCE
tara:strand:+ start:162 stop:1250 length:1089 start_codon:yes stop_codon:yes gene_type:complete